MLNVRFPCIAGVAIFPVNVFVLSVGLNVMVYGYCGSSTDHEPAATFTTNGILLPCKVYVLSAERLSLKPAESINCVMSASFLLTACILHKAFRSFTGSANISFFGVHENMA